MCRIPLLGQDSGYDAVLVVGGAARAAAAPYPYLVRVADNLGYHGIEIDCLYRNDHRFYLKGPKES